MLTNIFNLLQQQGIRLNCIKENQEKFLTEVVTQVEVLHPTQQQGGSAGAPVYEMSAQA